MSGIRDRLRNGEHGYGLVTKTLHWAIATAILAQFVVGYRLDVDDSGRGRGRGRGEGSGRGRGRGGDDYELFGDDGLLTVHAVLGVTILVLAIVRLAWRLSTPLPPWAPTLSRVERIVVHWTERALYLLMFVLPASGLSLIAVGDDDALGVHVAAHLAFFVVITVHVGMALKHQFIDRDGFIGRMT
jgi:cytochrome b561